tara:strand:- start:782 stop:1015 length:234 start_codon:yes stop_codon:yes gene_type:complete
MYKPAKEVNLWAMTNEEISRLTPGQWCYCGDVENNTLSRYYTTTPGGSHWVAHWQGNNERWNQFFTWVNNRKKYSRR